MKVRISFTVELDSEAQEAWMENYGDSKEELRERVKAYFENAVYESVPVQDLGVKVV